MTLKTQPTQRRPEHIKVHGAESFKSWQSLGWSTTSISCYFSLPRLREWRWHSHRLLRHSVWWFTLAASIIRAMADRQTSSRLDGRKIPDDNHVQQLFSSDDLNEIPIINTRVHFLHLQRIISVSCLKSTQVYKYWWPRLFIYLFIFSTQLLRCVNRKRKSVRCTRSEHEPWAEIKRLLGSW